MDAIRSTSSNTLIFAVYFFFFVFRSYIPQVKMRIVIIFIYRLLRKRKIKIWDWLLKIYQRIFVSKTFRKKGRNFFQTPPLSFLFYHKV